MRVKNALNSLHIMSSEYGYAREKGFEGVIGINWLMIR
jgi:hypothetical protein